MRVLSFSLDPQMLDPESTTAKRARGYGQYVEAYTVIVPCVEETKVVLSERVTVYGTGGRGKFGRLIRLYNLASRLAKASRYDVVSTQDPYYIGLAGYLLALRYSMGFEIQILGLYNLNRVRVALARYLLPKAGSMRILSPGLKDRLLSAEFGMKSAERMHVVPIYAEVSTLGFDTSKLAPEAAAVVAKNNADFNSQFDDRFNCVTVGRLIPVKNHELQFQAIAALKSQFPKLLLHVVGDGPMRPELEASVKKLGITEHVIFHGAKYHTELGTYLTQSDCFLLSSDTEGWGMVVIEAATAGLPIVMTDVGCAGTAIKNEVSGLIVPVGDQAAFTAALQRVLAEPAVQADLAHGAKEAIKNIATFEEIATGCVASWQQAAAAPL